MINLLDWIDVDDEVRIEFTDGEHVFCKINSVDDEEESGLDEMGLSVFTRDGGYVGIAESEIRSIEIVKPEEE